MNTPSERRICAVRLPGTSRARFADAGELSLSIGDWVVIRTAAGSEPARVVVAPDQWLDPVQMDAEQIVRPLDESEFDHVAGNIQRALDLIDTAADSLRAAGSQMFLSGLRFNLQGDTAIASYVGEASEDTSALSAKLSASVGTRVLLEHEWGNHTDRSLHGGGPGWPRTAMPDTFHEMLRDRFDVLREPGTFAPHGLPRLGSRVATPEGDGRLVAVDIRHWKATVALDRGEEVTIDTDQLSNPHDVSSG
jgi:cell fate regulator YaaT (PSP1 superfamily)